MPASVYLVDAFTDRLFHGNPTTIVVCDSWPEDQTLRRLAAEFGQSVTGFLVDRGPRAEYRVIGANGTAMGLVGHTSLAAAHVLLRLHGARERVVLDNPVGGTLEAWRDGDWSVLDFPAMPGQPCPAPAALTAAIKPAVTEVLVAPFGYVAVLEREDEVRDLDPDLRLIATLDRTAAIYTAPGQACDFVSRVFAPQADLPEDPVCGTAHRIMVPYWAARLGRDALSALQLSPRGGTFRCRHAGDRTILSGQAALVLQGSLDLPSS